MEHLLSETFNPHIEKVLKSYQTAATRSLSGPSPYVAAWGDSAKMGPIPDLEEYRKALNIYRKQTEGKAVSEHIDRPKNVPPFPVQSMPIFTPMDTTRVEKSETILENETIACFIVGGEKRLCLPQILNTVLRDFSLNQINNVCDDLHIFCSRCNPEQLEILKVTGVLPVSAPSCGLITKTDAERLCSALLYGKAEHSQREPPTPNSFKVYHECFGKCKGVFSPELYVNPYAKCIECCDCHGVFTPQKFVCHSHKCQENRTCHWGFDSANWRSYLLLVKCQDQEDRLQDLLDQMKGRFDFMSKFKRKQNAENDGLEHKRIKREETTPPSSADYMLPSGPYWLEHAKPGSAFRPWSPSIRGDKTLPPPPALMKDVFPGALPSFLQTGPPVLLNPERVVPLSESSRYERHFAPNVSLAPLSHQKKVESKREAHESTEYDLTDTSDDSVPVTPDNDTAPPFGGSTMKEELKMVEMLLDGKIPESRESRENFLQEFSNLHMSMELKLSSVMEELRRVKGENITLQKENEVLRLTNRDQFRELTDLKTSMMKAHLSQEKSKLNSPPPAHNGSDSRSIDDYQHDNVRMKREIKDLKSELERLTNTVDLPAALKMAPIMSPRKKALAQMNKHKEQTVPVDMSSRSPHD